MNSENQKRLAILTPSTTAPSFRYRIQNALPMLESRGWFTEVIHAPGKSKLGFLINQRERLKNADVVFVAKTKLNWLEAVALRMLCRVIIYDFDDAIYFRKPKRVQDPVGRSWLRQLRFFNVCKVADVVIAGNPVLAEKASKAAKRVEILPTAVDTDRYGGVEAAKPGSMTAVWIGLPTNLAYLEIIRPALAEIARRFPAFRLRIVSSARPEWDDVPIEFVPWSHAAEVQALKSARFGVMPLTDDDWSQGKCAFKLLQYMAAGLPCIASPVGANCDAVVNGKTGLWASSTEEWVEAMEFLLRCPDVQISEMAKSGQLHVNKHYSAQVIYDRLTGILEQLVRR